jgi:hypothetical protein
VQGNSTSLALSDRQQKAAVITGYMERFAAIDGRKELSPEIYDLYVETICGYRPPFSLRQIEKGLKDYLETGKKFPWPADLLDCMEEEI